MLSSMRDRSGRSLHDRDAGLASETREIGEKMRRSEDRAAPYVLALAIVFAVVVGLLIGLR